MPGLAFDYGRVDWESDGEHFLSNRRPNSRLPEAATSDVREPLPGATAAPTEAGQPSIPSPAHAVRSPAVGFRSCLHQLSSTWRRDRVFPQGIH